MEWLNFYRGQDRMEKTQSFGQPEAQGGGWRGREAPCLTACSSEKACRRSGRFRGARRRTEIPLQRTLPHPRRRPARRAEHRQRRSRPVIPQVLELAEAGVGSTRYPEKNQFNGPSSADVWSATTARPGTHGIQARHQFNTLFPRLSPHAGAPRRTLNRAPGDQPSPPLPPEPAPPPCATPRRAAGLQPSHHSAAG